ncbi:MAG: hypothetical protein ABSD48_17230 [Armatimonadota bacterium]|jgi:hypothetical protein
MPDVLIRGVSRKTLDSIKQKAARRGRSVQQELKQVIEHFGAQPDFDYFEAAKQLREELLKRGGVYSDSTETIRRDRQR